MLTNSPFLHQSSAPGTLLLRKRSYPRKSIAKLCVPFGWFPPECAQQVFCCTTRLPPAFAGLGCSFSDGCDTSPTEILRKLHLTGSRYLLQFADGSFDIRREGGTNILVSDIGQNRSDERNHLQHFGLVFRDSAGTHIELLIFIELADSRPV